MDKRKVIEFRTPVEFQSEHKVKNADHSYSHVWYTDFEDWCMMETKTGNVWIAGQKEEPVTTHEMVIRYRDDVSLFKGQRVIVEGYQYTIHAVDRWSFQQARYYTISLMEEETEI